MPTAEPRLAPPLPPPPRSPSSSPPLRLSPSPSQLTSPSSSRQHSHPSFSFSPPTMERSHEQHYQPDHPGHSHTHVHPYSDRGRKDPDALYHSSHFDPSCHHSHTGPRLRSLPSDHEYHRQHHPEFHSYQRQSHHYPHPSQHFQDSSHYRSAEDLGYGRQGHRHSIDSAAADTLLMLSAAAFMDPVDAQSILAAEGDKRMGTAHSTTSADDRQSSSASTSRHDADTQAHSFHSTHAALTHHPRRFSPPLSERSHLLPMAKTVSAPALSSASLPPRVYQSRHVVESESAGFSSPHISKHSASSPDGHTSIKRERSPVQSALSTVSRSSPPALIASAMVSEPPSTSVSVCITNDSSHGESSKQEPKAMQIDTDNEEPNKEQGDEEDEGEDEVMSEGVVHVNATLAPVSMSSQGKTRGTHQFTHSSPPVLPTISTSVSSLNQHADLDSPKTPTTPRTPRTPKQTKAPKSSKTTRMPKRSQSDYQGASGSRGGKSSLRDSLGDYFFSLFPPSASPATSPSSPFSFQAQLQMLTHNFVSVQPHADPCSPFRRAPTLISNATATPPFSPPASPNVDLIRDSLFHTGQSTLVGTDVPGIPPSTSSSTSSNPGSNVVSSSSTLPVSKPATSSRSHFKPRWHTQPYMMFLALRAMPDRTAARQELIMAAVELDKKFSAEKGLPRVFTGKTPMNSASACLTNNGDKYFIPFKPEGSRSTHFRLAYQPGDFDSVKKEYDAWMEQLIQQDWLQCFGTPKEGAIPLPRPNKTECRSLFEEQSRETALPRPEIQRAYSSPESRKRGADPEEEEQELDPGNIKKVKAESKAKVIEPSYGVANPQQQQQQQETAESQEDRKVADHLQRLDIKAITTQDGSLSLPPTPTVLTAADPSSSGIVTGPTKSSKESQSIHGYRLEDLDLEDVPKSLSDVVRVDISTTPNGGKGLFAQRDLPAGTPLGFYFGVPMTENEFDSLKDGVGQAQQYSVMYRRTVLDATDEQGQPYTDPEGKMYCPFHFMNEDPEGNVSFIAGSVVNQVICTSNQDIKTGEELLVFYSKEMDRGLSSAGGGHAQEGTSHGHSDNAEGKRSKVPRSRASSPTKRTTPAEDSGRPRRETVYKPVRYTR